MYLGAGVAADFRARIPWYKSDWKEGFSSGYRILAPSVYIFFASVIPALAFGEQIAHETHGAFNGVHVLLSTALAGVVQALVGGQPLLIVGVAEPTVLVYGFMYKFAAGQGFANVFVPWCSWVTIWTALILGVMALTGMCEFISKFTRFSGECFGMLIAILFMQQAIKGVAEEFAISRCGADAHERLPGSAHVAVCEGEFTRAEKIVNGLWALVLAVGTTATSMLCTSARSWPLFRAGLRSFLADYGVPLMVVCWSALSYALQDATPPGIPRRLALPNTWDEEATDNWDVVAHLGRCSVGQVGMAIIPATILSLLFYFDHNVSAQLAQQKDFQLVRPPAYNWDLLVLSWLSAATGFLGIPPVNGVIPQAPMHTKSLVTLKRMLLERDDVRRSRMNLSRLERPRSSVGLDSSTAAEQMGSATALGDSAASASHQVVLNSEGRKVRFEKDWIGVRGGVVPVNVKEQRLSNLLQACLVGACIAATPVVRRIPKSVLWGYFAYMSLEGLPGSEFWDRLLMLAMDRHKRVEMLKKEHPVYLETVRFPQIALFTTLQLLYTLLVWGITWAGAVGISFPFFIIILIPIRQYVMPFIFDAWTLSQLDSAEYEEAPPAPDWVVSEAAKTNKADESNKLYQERETLDAEMPGRAIKHHVSADEIQRRRNLSRGTSTLVRAATGPTAADGEVEDPEVCRGRSDETERAPMVAGDSMQDDVEPEDSSTVQLPSRMPEHLADTTNSLDVVFDNLFQSQRSGQPVQNSDVLP